MRREVEVDTKLAEIYERKGKAVSYLADAKISLARSVGVKPVYVTKTRREVRESLDELLALAKAKVADEGTASWTRRDIDAAVERVGTYRAEIAACTAEAKPLNAEFDAKPWSRFFLVQNHGGHIHSSMNCSTCFITTQFGWLPTLSGLTEKDAVEEHGTILCSVCFPSAPVEWTVGKQDTKPVCEGSGTYNVKPGTFRRTSYTGSGRAKCGVCEAWVGITTTGKIRKHDPAKVTTDA